MSTSFVLASNKVDQILKNLPADDREMMEAYLQDSIEKASKSRPLPMGALMFGATLAGFIGVGFMIIGFLYLVAPKIPISECATEPESFSWYHMERGLQVAETEELKCVWPDHTRTFLCVMKEKEPVTVPTVPK